MPREQSFAPLSEVIALARRPACRSTSRCPPASAARWRARCRRRRCSAGRALRRPRRARPDASATPPAWPIRRRWRACATALQRALRRRCSSRCTSTTRAAWGWPTCWPPCEAGIDRFDVSLGGLGGCPYAPGASGNISTEDVVHMLRRHGLRHRHDLGRLLRVARALPGIVGHEVPGQVAKAGPELAAASAPPADFAAIASARCARLAVPIAKSTAS